MKRVEVDKIVSDSAALLKMDDPHGDYTDGYVHRFIRTPAKNDKIRVVYQGDRPVGFFSWVWLTPEEGELFLVDQFSPDEEHFKRDKEDGLELWGGDFVSPYGHTRQIFKLIKEKGREMYGSGHTLRWKRINRGSVGHKVKGF